MKIIVFFITLLLLLSCGNHNNSVEANDSTNSFDTSYYETEREAHKKLSPQTKNLVRTVTIDAEVFHVVYDLDGTAYAKDANRTQPIQIDVYDDGMGFLRGGDRLGGWVRYSKNTDYEYECNPTGTTFYAFDGGHGF